MRKYEKLLKIAYPAAFMIAIVNLCFGFADASDAWYKSLNKPAFQPPDIVFPIVWLVIYALFAVSMCLVYLKPQPKKEEASEPPLKKSLLAPEQAPPFFANPREKALILYMLGAVLGVLWTFVFFWQHNDGGAVFLLIAVIILAVLLYSEVRRIDAAAAYTLIPYMLWLCFLLCLNFEIAFLN